MTRPTVTRPGVTRPSVTRVVPAAGRALLVWLAVSGPG